MQKKEQEVIKMMVAIFIGFCLTYLPSFLTTMVSIFEFVDIYQVEYRYLIVDQNKERFNSNFDHYLFKVYWNIFQFQIDPHKFHPLCHILSYIILWASPIINPIIYIVTQKRYRTAFAKLLTNMGWLKEQNFEWKEIHRNKISIIHII